MRMVRKADGHMRNGVCLRERLGEAVVCSTKFYQLTPFDMIRPVQALSDRQMTKDPTKGGAFLGLTLSEAFQ